MGIGGERVWESRLIKNPSRRASLKHDRLFLFAFNFRLSTFSSLLYQYVQESSLDDRRQSCHQFLNQ
jgi:hypothetical protein